jgi:signal transduction histidine kinase
MNVQPGRLNDTELVSRLDQLEKSAKDLRDEADKAAKANKSIDKTARESIKSSIQEFERTAKEVQERIKDDRPASAEVGQLLAQAKSMQGMLSKLTMSQAGGEAWNGVQSGCEVLSRAWSMGK